MLTVTGLHLCRQFQALGPADQAAILEHNLPLVHRFRQALQLHSGLSWRALTAAVIGAAVLEEEAANTPTDLSGTGPRQLLQYTDLFSAPWCGSAEVETLHRALMADIAAWVEVEDEVQVTLLGLILAFNHDFLDLEARAQVRAVNQPSQSFTVPGGCYF